MAGDDQRMVNDTQPEEPPASADRRRVRRRLVVNAVCIALTALQGSHAVLREKRVGLE